MPARRSPIRPKGKRRLRVSRSPRASGSGFEAVRAIARTLPDDVEEGTSWGAPALKVRGTMFACQPTHRSAEPGSLVVRVDFFERDALLAADSNVFYLKPHYVNYPCVLVRLDRIRRGALKELLLTGYRFVSRSKRRRTRG